MFPAFPHKQKMIAILYAVLIFGTPVGFVCLTLVQAHSSSPASLEPEAVPRSP